MGTRLQDKQNAFEIILTLNQQQMRSVGGVLTPPKRKLVGREILSYTASQRCPTFVLAQNYTGCEGHVSPELVIPLNHVRKEAGVGSQNTSLYLE